MTDFLLLTMYAPLSSWGDIAIGQNRGSWDRPSRSAVLGLLAAALGLTRDDQASHDALDDGYRVAVRVDVAGSPMTDYHTAQTASSASMRKRRPATRAELLDVPDPQTILSSRNYRQDALATVAVWARRSTHSAEEPRWSLSELKEALLHPAFVLYAGRKANVFGLPLHPAVESATSLADALSKRPSALESLTALDTSYMPRQTAHVELEVSHDPCEGFESGLRPLRRDIRRDAAAHRARWQFAERVVEVGAMMAGEHI